MQGERHIGATELFGMMQQWDRNVKRYPSQVKAEHHILSI